MSSIEERIDGLQGCVETRERFQYEHYCLRKLRDELQEQVEYVYRCHVNYLTHGHMYGPILPVEVYKTQSGLTRQQEELNRVRVENEALRNQLRDVTAEKKELETSLDEHLDDGWNKSCIAEVWKLKEEITTSALWHQTLAKTDEERQAIQSRIRADNERLNKCSDFLFEKNKEAVCEGLRSYVVEIAKLRWDLAWAKRDKETHHIQMGHMERFRDLECRRKTKMIEGMIEGLKDLKDDEMSERVRVLIDEANDSKTLESLDDLRGYTNESEAQEYEKGDDELLVETSDLEHRLRDTIIEEWRLCREKIIKLTDENRQITKLQKEMDAVHAKNEELNHRLDDACDLLDDANMQRDAEYKRRVESFERLIKRVKGLEHHMLSEELADLLETAEGDEISPMLNALKEGVEQDDGSVKLLSDLECQIIDAIIAAWESCRKELHGIHEERRWANAGQEQSSRIIASMHRQMRDLQDEVCNIAEQKEALQKKLDEATNENRQIDDVQHELNEAYYSINTMQDDLKELRRDLRDAEEKKEVLRDKLARRDDQSYRISVLERDLDMVINANTSRYEELRDLRQKLKSANDENEQLRKGFDGVDTLLRDELRDLRQKLKSVSDVNEKLREEFINTEENKYQLQLELERVKQEKAETVEELLFATQQHLGLIQEQTDHMAAQEREIASLNEKLKMQTDMEAVDDATREAYHKKIAKYKKEIQALKAKIRALKSNLQAAMKGGDDCARELRLLSERSKSQIESQRRDHRHSIGESRKRVGQLEAEVADLTAVNSWLRENHPNTFMNKTLELANAQIATLRQQLADKDERGKQRRDKHQAWVHDFAAKMRLVIDTSKKTEERLREQNKWYVEQIDELEECLYFCDKCKQCEQYECDEQCEHYEYDG